MMPDLQSTNAQLNSIRNKVYSGHRISFEDGLYLFKNADLSWLGSVANYIREQKHGDKTYFNKNFHIEPTNVCLYTCSFCSYSRLIKKRAEGWEYSLEQMMDIVKSFDEKPVTEVHIVGGVMPKYDLEFYCKLFEEIKNIDRDYILKH